VGDIKPSGHKLFTNREYVLRLSGGGRRRRV